MRIFGVFLISIIPMIIGVKKYMILLNKPNIIKQIFALSNRLLDQIKYSQKELYYILKKENEDFFVFSNPIVLNLEYFTQNGFKTEEISKIKEFLKALQGGDRSYINSQDNIHLKEIEILKDNFEKELKNTGKLYITVFSGLSAVIFLALI